MAAKRFPPEVASELKWYVYRLIDPRDGATFYVGMGQGNPVFQHANNEVGELISGGDAPDSDLDLKRQRIQDILRSGIAVWHVIQRHGMDRSIAFEVEAALIDAYPGLTNKVRGHRADDFGVTSAGQLLARYAAAPLELLPGHKVALIDVHQTAFSERPNVYEAVRYGWRMSMDRAQTLDYVLAVIDGLVQGVYRPLEWKRADAGVFPGVNELERIGFVGEEAAPEIQAVYMRRRVPPRAKGNMSPVRNFPTER